MAGGLPAPTTKEIVQRDRRARGQTDAAWPAPAKSRLLRTRANMCPWGFWVTWSGLVKVVRFFGVGTHASPVRDEPKALRAW